jgi:hypothetical protein
MKVFLALLMVGIGASAHAAVGLRFEKDVLKGALVRAGGPGGQESLPDAVVKNLCERGFSKVFYLYPTRGFSNQGVHRCSGGKTIEYLGASWKGDGLRAILTAVVEAVQTNSGPVLAHCWNGWHASGEVAAVALIQFCNWDGKRAADYWAANIPDKKNLGTHGHQEIMARIRKYKPFSDLRLSESQKSRVCP